MTKSAIQNLTRNPCTLAHTRAYVTSQFKYTLREPTPTILEREDKPFFRNTTEIPKQTCVIHKEKEINASLPFNESLRYLHAWDFSSLEYKPENTFYTSVWVDTTTKSGLAPTIKGFVVFPNRIKSGAKTVAVVSDNEETLKQALLEGADYTCYTSAVPLLVDGSAGTFDYIIATTDTAKIWGKYAKDLKDKLPNKRRDTLVDDVITAMKKARDTVRYEADENGKIQCTFADAALDENAVKENLQHLIKTIIQNQPDAVKTKQYVQKVALGQSSSPMVFLNDKYIQQLNKKKV